MRWKQTFSALWSTVRQAKAASPLLRVLLNEFFIATVLFVVWILFFDNNNLLVWLRTTKKLEDQARRIEYLEEQIVETEERLTRLRSDKDTLERFAREQYLFHKDGEDVYVVVE